MIHRYLEEQSIEVDKSFDFEIVPLNFNRNNPMSKMSVALKLI